MFSSVVHWSISSFLGRNESILSSNGEVMLGKFCISIFSLMASFNFVYS